MSDNFLQYLDGKEAAEFEARPFHSADGDFLTFYFRPDEAYAERVDALLTVYRSIESNELVGCKIKGIRLLVANLRNFGVTIEPEAGNRLNLLFLSAASQTTPDVKKYYEEMGRYTSHVPLDVAGLCFA